MNGTVAQSSPSSESLGTTSFSASYNALAPAGPRPRWLRTPERRPRYGRERNRAWSEIIRKLLDAHRIPGLDADGVGVNRRRVRTALQHHDFGLRTRRVGGRRRTPTCSTTS